VVSNFIVQALAGEPLTIYGDGSQTRSLCFVDDEIAGLLALLDSDLAGPVNIGNPDERTISEIAAVVLKVTGSASHVVHRRSRPTTPPDGARTSRSPASGLAGRRAWTSSPGSSRLRHTSAH